LILYLLTLPVTAASCERAHSKVSLVKSAVRASMNADRLEDLVFISSEKKRPIQSNFQQLLTDLHLSTENCHSEFVCHGSLRMLYCLFCVALALAKCACVFFVCVVVYSSVLNLSFLNICSRTVLVVNKRKTQRQREMREDNE